MLSICRGEAPFFSLDNEIKVKSLNIPSTNIFLSTPKIIFKVRQLVKQEGAEALITVESMSALFTIPSLFGLAIKHICWEHFNFYNDLGKFGRKVARHLAARYCDSVVTLTERDKELWLENTKHRGQITAIANPSPFPPQAQLCKVESKKVISIGRLTHIKGFDLLLGAWKEVLKEFPDWMLEIIGDGEDKESLVNYAQANGLSDNVLFVGNTNSIEKYYRGADIYCLSSRFEGFPMVLLEALSFGLPVVSFNCDTGPEEILSNTGSFLVEAGNVKNLSEGLIEMIKNKSLRAEISRESLIKSADYQIMNIVEQWVELLKR
jgi:glycosyltransferase involved in cell wall biosynthesis